MVNIEIKENVAIVRPARPIADSKDAQDVIHTVRFQTGRNNMLLDPLMNCLRFIVFTWRTLAKCSGAKVGIPS